MLMGMLDMTCWRELRRAFWRLATVAGTWAIRGVVVLNSAASECAPADEGQTGAIPSHADRECVRDQSGSARS